MHARAVREKRRALRHDCVAVTRWSYLNHSCAYDARIFNFSSSGIYLETDVALKPGATVLIRVDRCLSGGTTSDSSQCLPTIAVADSKWCQELPDACGSRYGIGLRYQIPSV